ncbi:ATP-binding protein [Cellulophaga lytica]|nr:ATP-binding protein [Cellulophaga lytica]
MNREIASIINNDCEGPNLDYKKVEYPLGREENKNEFLKDISAFANHLSDNDKFIIIGVKEKNGRADVFYEIENLTDEANYQEFIYDNIEPRINFEYKSIIFKGKKLAYFRIFGNKDRPYLFKKNLQNPISRKIEFKIGDGFIKMGSSTKKIDRNDLENIYKNRFSVKDRKGDLKIEAYIKSVNQETLKGLNLSYLDIDISNISNKSIEFDIEMKIYKNEKYMIISESKLLKEIKKKEINERTIFENNLETTEISLKPQYLNFREDDNYIIVERNNYQKKAAIDLAQNSSERNVFGQNLIIQGFDFNEVKAEIIIRSDDFTEGYFKKNVKFNEKYEAE